MIRLKTRAPLVAVGVFLVIYVVPQVVGLRINTSTTSPPTAATIFTTGSAPSGQDPAPR